MKHSIAFLDSSPVLVQARVAEGGFVFATSPNAVDGHILAETTGTDDAQITQKAGLASISLTYRS